MFPDRFLYEFCIKPIRLAFPLHYEQLSYEVTQVYFHMGNESYLRQNVGWLRLTTIKWMADGIEIYSCSKQKKDLVIFFVYSQLFGTLHADSCSSFLHYKSSLIKN